MNTRLEVKGKGTENQRGDSIEIHACSKLRDCFYHYEVIFQKQGGNYCCDSMTLNNL